MSYQLLLVVERPDLSHPELLKKWNNYTDNIKSISNKYTNLKVLSENVLLLTLDKTLTSVRDALFHLNGMDYKYALFDTEIQWHEVSKDS
ncbi:hypothetical protein KA005_09885 [bacterium]|nr:hypothetical protein [bacterium]